MYARLRPNLVTLVDAFDFHDNELSKSNYYIVDNWWVFSFIYWIDSCLGRYDGQVYEALMERARLNPSNRQKVIEDENIQIEW